MNAMLAAVRANGMTVMKMLLGSLISLIWQTFLNSMGINIMGAELM